MDWLLPASVAVFAYVLGSIPFSYLVVRALSRRDIREEGSGNVGATNVLRTQGKKAGIIALLFDIAKGWLAVYLAMYLTGRPDWPFVAGPTDFLHTRSFWLGLAALLAVAGHMFPVWLGFRGGKGVATAAGVFLALSPAALGLGIIVFLAVATTSRYISLASITTAAAIPLLMRFVTHESYWMTVFAIGISILVIIRHHANIARIATGTERKFPS